MGYFAAERQYSIPTTDLLSWQFNGSKVDEDAPIYIDAKNPSNSISSNQAWVLIRKLVAGFHAAGLKKGDCVCLSSFNDVYYPIVFLGILAAGGVFTGTNPSYTHYELVHHIQTSQAKFLIAEPELLQGVLAAGKECGIPESKVWVFDVMGTVPQGFRSWKALLGHGEKDWARFNNEKTCKETTGARMFSSGTTGLPKAAMWSHHNMIAQGILAFEIDKKPYTVRRMLALPMFHAATAPMAHILPLRTGEVAVVMRRFDLVPYIASIEKFKITDLTMVPPIVIALIMCGITDRYNLSSIKAVIIGAAPLGKDSQDRLKDLLPSNATVHQVWGMTETTCLAAMFHYPVNDNTSSVGFMLPNIDAKLIDDDGKDITAFNTRGELCVRGPLVIPGYFANSKANAASFDGEGFFKTGDIAYRDETSKKWYMVDRKKELIKVRGFQVTPPEIETVLLSHPLVIDAAVIGVKLPPDMVSEHPRAYVVRRPGSESKDCNERILKGWCGNKLAKYKELTGGIKFVEEIPKNASGKILKKVLRETAKEELSQGKSKL